MEKKDVFFAAASFLLPLALPFLLRAAALALAAALASSFSLFAQQQKQLPTMATNAATATAPTAMPMMVGSERPEDPLEGALLCGLGALSGVAGVVVGGATVGTGTAYRHTQQG